MMKERFATRLNAQAAFFLRHSKFRVRCSLFRLTAANRLGSTAVWPLRPVSGVFGVVSAAFPLLEEGRIPVVNC